MRKAICLSVCILLLPMTLFAQTSGKISGTITSSDGTPLIGANVVVVGTSLGSASGSDGNYYILDVPTGTYSVRADYIGYQSVTVSNVKVSNSLTTDIDYTLQTSAVKGAAVEIVAERALIQKSATNTTRVIDQEVINNVAQRGVENLIAMQTGVVNSGGALYVRGSRSGDMAYYVDGVYTVNPFSLSNTSVVSNAAMEDIAFQSGGFDAEFGNSNGGMVNTTTKSGTNQLIASAEFVTDIGSEATVNKDDLHSYGYKLMNINVGGPLMDNMKYFLSFENINYEDASPSTSYFPTISLDEINVPDTTSDGSPFGFGSVSFTEAEGLSQMVSLGLVDSLAAASALHYQFQKSYGDTTLLMFSDYQRMYGKKPNAGLSRNTFSGNITADVGQLRLKAGGTFSSKDSRGDLGESTTISQGDYPYTYSLLNSDNTPWYESKSVSGYVNATQPLGALSYIKVNMSHYSYSREYGDNNHKDDIAAYGDPTAPGNEYLRGWGKNPISIENFAYFSNKGVIYDEYRKSSMSYTGIKGDYVNQWNNHEIKAGLEWRKHTLRDYRLAQPMEIAEGYRKAEVANYGPNGVLGADGIYNEGETFTDVADSLGVLNGVWDEDEAWEDVNDDLVSGDANYIDVTHEDWEYTTYRNAYTENIGYDQQGNEQDSYSPNGTSPPGEPVILGAYVQDKIELEDLTLNIGMRFDSFDFGSEAPESWDDLHLLNGRIDHDASGYKKVDPYTYISPRVGMSFPVTDQTVLHAQYGKFVQHPILNRLYLSDSELAANLTQGNMTVSPNGSLKPEKTTQYELGFAQQLGNVAAIDITGYYKEIRDYTMMANRSNAFVDGAQFSWAQYMNGDYGVVKGLSAAFKMRRMKGVLIDANYTMQWANGTGSDPASFFNIAWIGDNYPTSVNPLDFDQRHTGSVMVDYRGGNFMGICDLGVNALYQFGSGTAYTPSTIQSAVFGRGWYNPVGAINSSYKPWTSTLDLRFEFDDIVGTGLTAYLIVLNALNTENVVGVYEGTGQAGEDGWMASPEGQVWLKGNPIGESFYYDRLRDSSNWSNPRMVRFGLSYSL